MIKRYVWLLLIGMLLALPAQAQNLKSMALKGQTDKLAASVQPLLANAPDDIRLNFYMGKAFGLRETARYHVDSAYHYYQRCLDLFRDLKNASLRDKLTKEGISAQVVSNHINALTQGDYEDVCQRNTIADYDDFARRFPSARQAGEVIARRDALRFDAFYTPERSVRDYRTFMEQYPDLTNRKQISDSLCFLVRATPTRENLLFFIATFPRHAWVVDFATRLYNLCRADGELLSLNQYYSFMHDAPVTEQQLEDMSLARRAWEMGLTSSTVAYRECFSNTGVVPAQNDELNRRLAREGAQTGDLQFSLMWNNYNDIDLHVTDPNGEEIYYRHSRSLSGGWLDVDMNVYYKAGRYSDQPVENIFWPFGSAPAGHYVVKVVHYRKHSGAGTDDPTPYLVRVRCNGQDTLISGEMTYRGAGTSNTVLSFDYSPPERFYRPLDDSLKRKYVEYIEQAAPRELAWVAVLRLMEQYIRRQDWNNASGIMARYARYFSDDQRTMVRIRDTEKLLRGDVFRVNKEKLSGVNTAGEEYAPVPSADEQRLYFCGRSRPGSLGKEDIFVARAVNGQFSAPQPLEGLNTANENEAPLSVSVDGNTLLMFRDGDLYYASRTRDGWSPPQAFPEPVNTKYWEGDAMLTADGRAILFASNRPGGENLHVRQNYYHGNTNYASDLYICERTATGWGPAINLGKAVNTRFCERSPFLHPDLKTLYFSSDGQYGLGDLDVFMVKRTTDTSWTSWGKPVNLGKYINTADADWGYRVSSSGRWAYYAAADARGETKEDIWRFELPAELRPEPVLALSGRISDTDGQALDAVLHWVDLTSGEEVGVATADPATGRYFILLPAGRHYGYYAENDQAFSVSDHLDLSAERTYRVISQDLTLYTVDKLVQSGRPLRINNLFFDTDKSSLRPESFPELRRLALIITKNPGLMIEIMGHTDDQGPDDYNQQLSEARAQSVRQYLINAGVPPTALKAVGYGESRPVQPNTSDASRQLNRRVEFRFYR